MINRSKLANGKIGYEKLVVHQESGIGEDLNKDLQLHLFINYEANGG